MVAARRDSSARCEAGVGAATVARRVDAGDDRTAMGLALNEARLAADAGEVPVGAVVVRDGEVVGRGHNRRESWGDPMAHAEMIALAQAAARQQGWRLEGCAVYVTLEPCAMCAGAMVNARVDRLVFGGAGSEGRLLRLDREPRPRTETESPNHGMLRRPGGGEFSIVARVLPASTVERAFRLRER